MLTEQEIDDLSLFLIEDIETLNLSDAEIQERANSYLENIAGLETIPQKLFQNLVNQIVKKAKFS